MIFLVLRYGKTSDKNPGREVLPRILGEGVPPGSPNPVPISDQKMSFSHPFWDLASKIHTPFQTFSDLAFKKLCQNPFRILIFLFLSYSFGVETINTFLHSCSSLKINARFQTKISQVYTRFQTRNGAKTLPFRTAHILYGLYRGVRPRKKRATCFFVISQD